jgi:hypothetical protein
LEPTVEDGSQMRSVPSPMETMVEEKAASDPEPTPELAPKHEPVHQEPPPKTEEISCPQCKTIIDSNAVTCWACGTNIKEALMKRSAPEPEIIRPEPVVEQPAQIHVKSAPPAEKPAEPEEDHRSGEVKKSVSIRKIIKRK